MKKKYFILWVAIFVSGIAMAQELQKNFINYQGVARNGADQLMANENMTLGITLKTGSATGAAVYAENHSITTDANGVFSVKIGNGDSVSGNFDNIPWGNEATFVTVQVNGTEIGTTEMMAVPYALSSGDAPQQADEVPYDNAASGLTATNTQEAIDELMGSSTIDADADPTNELQTISFDATSNQISLTDGGTITIPSGGTDADTDPTNELQDISLSGTGLSISDGSTIDLSAILPPGGTDDQNAAEVPFDNSASGLTATDAQAAIDELAASGVVDTDNQNLTYDAATNILEIEDGNTVDLSSLSGGGGSAWSQDGDDVYYDTGKVGIGIIPNGLHQIHDPLESYTQYTVDAYGSESGDGLVIGLSDGGLFGPVAQITNREEGPFIIGNGGMSNLILDRLGNIETAEDLYVGGAISSASLNGVGTRNVMADADGNLVIGAGSSGSSLWSQADEDINYTGGNVGIGVFVPTGRTEIAANSTTSFPQLVLNEDGDDFARLAFKNTFHAGAQWHIAGTARNGFSGATNSKLNFWFTNDNGAADRLTITGAGNVGIGTTDPASKLDVSGDIRTSGEVHRPSTGAANMVPIAYGNIAADGSIISGSGNFTVNRIRAGNYQITIIGEAYDDGYTALLTPYNNGGVSGFMQGSVGSDDKLFVRHISRIAGAAGSAIDIDSPIGFLVYKP
ncbi:hypothetical protein FGM00_16335 [Aggregatimonas sangjinii]|uniref:Uncharacterized protein n=1 Tax=Aggregatimonas sangjinii TaxID=2583587 RepID=A0A5B7SXH0_9FLAO|nr:hypothetical protein [Aggregatimonas sangjinii]QCX01601.1 hypothetical protein FGM00_16335 [Aggregatimonas sangjinii]